MKDSISQAEFSAIVTQIMTHHGDVASFSVSEKRVSVKIDSMLRHECTEIFYDFDDGGRITGRYAYAQTRNNSALSQSLGNEIAACIKRIRSE